LQKNQTPPENIHQISKRHQTFCRFEDISKKNTFGKIIFYFGCYKNVYLCGMIKERNIYDMPGRRYRVLMKYYKQYNIINKTFGNG
jgi:hypothetical protein